jgi:hypothetical protein
MQNTETNKKSLFKKISFHDIKSMDQTIEMLKNSLYRTNTFIDKITSTESQKIKSFETIQLNKIKITEKFSKNHTSQDVLPEILISDTNDNYVVKSEAIYKNSSSCKAQSQKKKDCFITSPESNKKSSQRQRTSIQKYFDLNYHKSDKEAKIIHSRVFGKEYDILKSKEYEISQKEKISGKNMVAQKQICEIKSKVHFIKEVYNYIYPKIMLDKIQIIKNKINNIKSRQNEEKTIFNSEPNILNTEDLLKNNKPKKYPKKNFLYSNSNFHKFMNFQKKYVTQGRSISENN